MPARRLRRHRYAAHGVTQVAGTAQGLDSMGRIAGMGLMGLGGLVSAVGGFIFIIIVIKAMMSKTDDQAQNNSVHAC